MKSRWTPVARFLILLFLLVLFLNAMSLFVEIRRDMSYANRAYGLSALDDCFNDGRYQELYKYTLKNGFTDEKVEVDVSEYEAFGRYYNAYVKARIYEDNDIYLKQMEKEKASITWNKILSVIERLELEMKE